MTLDIHLLIELLATNFTLNLGLFAAVNLPVQTEAIWRCVAVAAGWTEKARLPRVDSVDYKSYR